MEAKTLIQGSAQLLTIVNLKKGDIYKRYVKEYSEAKLYFGVVLDVMFNGQDAAIHALEFDSSYSSATISRKVFGNDTELAIFPADPSEFQIALSEIQEVADRSVQTKERELDKARQDLSTIIAAHSLELMKPEIQGVVAPIE